MGAKSKSFGALKTCFGFENNQIGKKKIFFTVMKPNISELPKAGK